MVSRRDWSLVGVMIVAACTPRPPAPLSARAPVSPPAHASVPAGDVETQRIDAWWHTIAEGKDAETAWGFTAVVHGVGGDAERCTGAAPTGPDCLTSLLRRVAPPTSWHMSGDCSEHSYCGTTADIKVVVQLDDSGVKAIALTGTKRWTPEPVPSAATYHARLLEFSATRDRICRCPDRACVDTINAEDIESSRKFQHQYPHAPMVSERDADATNAIGADIGRCLDALRH